MTDDLAACERADQAATPGPWHLYENTVQAGNWFGQGVRANCDPFGRVCKDAKTADAAFIALSRSALPALVARVRELEKFKAYVHKRLDDAGIDTHPDGPHSKEGCRVGDRLDIALSKPAKIVTSIRVE